MGPHTAPGPRFAPPPLLQVMWNIRTVPASGAGERRWRGLGLQHKQPIWLLSHQMFVLVLSEASRLQLGAAGVCVPWVEERVLSGLERSAGPGQLPGAGLQQVRRSPGDILPPRALTWNLIVPPRFHRGTYFGWGRQQAAPGGGFLMLRPDLDPGASILQQLELRCS